MIFQWNGWNRDHIGAHGVSPIEAQYIVELAKPPFPRPVSDDKYLVWGQSERGRYLQVIFVFLPDVEVDYLALSQLERVRFESGEEVGFVIHSMEMTDDQKRSYRKLKRQRT